MPDSTPRDAVRTIRSQLRRVRWRRNLFELQRALYLLIATAAAGASVIVLLALRADTMAFAVALGGVALAGVVLGAAIVVATRRRWLGHARTSLWIDRQARLQGRLSTLVELATRRGAEPALLPLLVEENHRRLRTWAPEILLPESFPGGALGAAVAATTVLCLVLFFGDRLVPPPEIVVPQGERPLGRLTRVDARLASRREIVPALADRDEPEEPTSPLTRGPRELQERIRNQLWGRTWQAAEAMARTENRDMVRRSSATENSDGERSWQIARPASPRALARSTKGEAAGGRRGESHDGQSGSPTARADSETIGPGEPAQGAGSATDPNLLGVASETRAGNESFELPIAARVRSAGGGPRPPSGDAPPAALDARPDLAARQRRDAPVVRMAVPAAYEGIVRHVFAHPEAARP